MLWNLNFFKWICTQTIPKMHTPIIVAGKIISCGLKDNKNNSLLFLWPCLTLSFHLILPTLKRTAGWKCNLVSGRYQDRVLYFLSTQSCFNHQLLPVNRVAWVLPRWPPCSHPHGRVCRCLPASPLRSLPVVLERQRHQVCLEFPIISQLGSNRG